MQSGGGDFNYNPVTGTESAPVVVDSLGTEFTAHVSVVCANP
jgi:hypothetical protein